MPAVLGSPARIDYDYEYEPQGTCILFLMCAPFRG